MGPRVLIVEHELVTAEPLVLILSWSGFNVDRAHDAAQAQAQIGRSPPDLVLVNEKLPGGRSGLELCRDLRRHPQLRALPIVLFGAPDEADVPWRQVGATRFLRKPIGIRLLPTLIRELLLRSHSDGGAAEVQVPAG